MQQVIRYLRPETIDLPGGLSSAYLAGSVDFPGHQDVTVVVRPPTGVLLTDPAMLDAADARCVALVARLDDILRSAADLVSELFRRYFPAVTVGADALISDLRLTHVKVMFEQGEELILYGNPHYLNFDLNLRVGPDFRVTEAWFDG